jgi:hypothetical protein
MYKSKIFVSFDYENDRNYKFMLNALSANPKFDFAFKDKSSAEINSSYIPTVKAALARKINEATYTLVIVGAEANKLHKDHIQIGYRNWQNFEIAKSKEYGNKLIGVKINSLYQSPEELLNSGASWARSFSVESIVNAIEEAKNG